MSSRTIGMVLLALAAGMTTGCHRKEFLRNQSIAMDPSIVASDPAAGVPNRVTFVDRHPMLRKPVEYYQSTGTGTAGKVAAAALIGVPAGILGEMRQIVVGCPPGF
ncbi:hypothetical protein [Tautonia sociabilis]|uniref:Uncharacterized protein n=1 Tax=Tautonia sociabilis TaxID=2080755 RepID=A0A432MEY6_9BACT|nr:hypothetical protein [Tautonia sociabilis]RUL84325.1 hypothetical protein TsocGM_20565 [Tautonia sociabilis]